MLLLEDKSDQFRLRQLEIEEAQLHKRLEMIAKEKGALKKTLSKSHSRSKESKLAIFEGLFRGRSDAYPKRWENLKTGRRGYSPACSNEWKRGICQKPKIKCSLCPHQAFLPLTKGVLYHHLAGIRDYQNHILEATVGIYPLLPDGSCWFLAVDFDKASWERDVEAFWATCREKGVPATVERSRSGKGAHVWIFFTSPVQATEARKMGTYLMTETMERCPEIGFESYDRFFPNQDTLPLGGFGNLIALPLQKLPRDRGNSVFVDQNFYPYQDQWAHLASIEKMMPEQVSVLAKKGGLRVRAPLDEPWTDPPSRIKEAPLHNLPPRVDLVWGNQIYLEKEGLPPSLINRLLRLAAFQNPEFYRAQAKRLPTYDKPRVISCGELFPHHLALPRGCLDEVLAFLKSLEIEVAVQDRRFAGKLLKTSFLGKLDREQKKAVSALSKHSTGVLAAHTAFGKTVVALYMIAKRKRNTLILVHRRALLDQWLVRLKNFLDLSDIGSIGQGKRKPLGKVDVALIQSLFKQGSVDDIVADYGHVIIDECHHISAFSFEAVIKACKAKFILGLTATAIRRDGHHPIIFMQCGPVRFEARGQVQPFIRRVVQRMTEFQLASDVPFHAIYNALSIDTPRNALITKDVLEAIKSKRSPLILTERKDHLFYLAQQFKRVKNVMVLHGGMKVRERERIKQQLTEIPDDEERLLISTGRYLGEGFDDPRLDTLFLVMPVSWKGTLAQYVGRLHRVHELKKEVVVFDYVDHRMAVLLKMSEKRLLGYRSLGYSIDSQTAT